MSSDSDPQKDPKSRLHSFHALRDALRGGLPSGPAPASPRASNERVTVRRERSGRGGKTVTIAEGPGLAAADLAALARDAARGLGVGVRVEEQTLVVQGDQSERLAAWLAERGFAGVVRGN